MISTVHLRSIIARAWSQQHEGWLLEWAELSSRLMDRDEMVNPELTVVPNGLVKWPVSTGGTCVLLVHGEGSNGELVLARHTWAQGMSWERRDDVTSWKTESSRGQLVSFVEASRGQCMSLGSSGATCALVNLSLANISIGKSLWEPHRKLNKFTMSRAREAFAFTPRLCFSLYLVTVVEHVSSHSSMYPTACTNATDRASWRSVNVAIFDSSTIVSSDEEFVLWDNI